ncbi:hypothetical protein FP2506_11357 [Fulvimarina pelagi HTCC2506]|uniref:Uncharacterized protein n=1 Tax=Fulvimarina pelagi HTCC2506 TaxID=314231 RepID=Q0FZ08_9HYPH|nr:hypothetical protein [Fulvimarina pelagi]EAU40150.1 hypothetical protein FP2506_11357 [Fulvimarina pelagi HTCC2506]
MTDYCTLWPDRLFGVEIGEACCKPHDEAYDAGGSLVDFVASNVDLGACVAALGLSAWGVLMAIGTTLFGWIFFRWRRKGLDKSRPFR